MCFYISLYRREGVRIGGMDRKCDDSGRLGLELGRFPLISDVVSNF